MDRLIYWFKPYIFGFKKFLISIQVETYVLIILPAIWILISCFFEKSILLFLLESKKDFILWSFFYGGYLIKIGFILFSLYFYFKLASWVGFWLGKKISKDDSPSTIHLKQFLLSVAYIMLAIGLYNVVFSLTLRQVAATSTRTSIIAASQLYMSMDDKIFGGYPQIWIQKFSMSNILDYLLIQAYSKLPLFLAIVLIGLLCFNKLYFRKFLIAIFIAPFLAMPFWYALPAVSPNEMYRNNIFSVSSISTTQKQYEEAVTSKRLQTYLQDLEEAIANPHQKYPLIFTNPSMHVAWGTIITYFAIILWWPLGFIFIPWLIFNILSTLYTLQHYAVDLPCGFVCAIIAIIITHYIFKFEKKYYTGNYRSLYFVNVVQDDVAFLKATLKTIWLKRRRAYVSNFKNDSD